MIKLDDDLLQELGLGSLPPDEKKKMLAHIYETLEMRVGMELAKQMTDAQLSEFEEFINRNDEAGALRWLEANFPNYKEVVSAEFDKLKLEIKQVAPHVVASSQQQAAAAQVSGSDPAAGVPYQTQQQHVPPVSAGNYPPAPPAGMGPQQPSPNTGQQMPPVSPNDRPSDYDLAG
jgi:hypothetical protein